MEGFEEIMTLEKNIKNFKTTEIYTHVSKANIASIKNLLNIILKERGMSTSRGMYICNTAYIPPNYKEIRNADINKLGEIDKEVR